MGRARKGPRRKRFIERIAAAVAHPDIYGKIDYRNSSEDKIKTFMYSHLVDEVERIHRELSPSVSPERNKRKAQHSVVWEGDVSRPIHHLKFLGTQHRPDFEVLLPDTHIAIEIKRISSGQGVREGLGQALVYGEKYHFVVYLAIDVTRDHTLKASLESDREQAFLSRLWDLHNVRFVVA